MWHGTNIEKEMKDKRAKKDVKEKTQRKFKGNFLMIQRLSAEVSGKAQKYSRIGPREFVPIDCSQEVTMENIKQACEEYFSPLIGPNLNCDVLAGERGPSCMTVDQIPDLKIIHIRFVAGGKATYENVDDSSAATGQHSSVEALSNPADSATAEKPKASKLARLDESPTKYPLCLSVSEMIKLGKLGACSQSITVVNIYAFDINIKSWSQVPQTVEFQEESESCGEGGFRRAYNAKSKHPEFKNKTWVIKKYLPKAKDDIENLGLTLEEHTKKTVQMHSLAKNFASQLEKNIKKDDLEEFGQPLRYHKIFYGETTDKDFVTVEEFISGQFIKYINNNGKVPISVADDDVNGLKAQCLSHFSYVKSESQLLLVDVQGSGEDLYDPEIASAELYDDKKAILYCVSNLSKMAIENFVKEHACNKYCKLVNLEPIVQ